MLNNEIRPIHPGEVLREEFLVPLELGVTTLASALDVPVNQLKELVQEQRGVTVDDAYRLARYFDTTPEFWINLQITYCRKTSPVREDHQRVETA